MSQPAKLSHHLEDELSRVIIPLWDPSVKGEKEHHSASTTLTALYSALGPHHIHHRRRHPHQCPHHHIGCSEKIY